MIIPPKLKQGDTIGIVACARKIKLEELAPAIKLFKIWGLEVLFGENLFKEHDQFSGCDEDRAADLQSMIDNPKVKAIISARGGYGSVKIVDRVNFGSLKTNPKWICGFSDITVFHSHLQKNISVATLHSLMPSTLPTSTPQAIETFRRALFGESFQISLDAKNANKNFETISGKIVGGNLSILYSLLGSASDLDTDNCILFLEDLDEYLYHIDRMMMALDRAGKLKNLKALLIGGMSDMKDNTIPFGKTAEEIILDITSKYNYPVITNIPCGHIDDNRAMILGKEVKLEMSNEVVVISF